MRIQAAWAVVVVMVVVVFFLMGMAVLAKVAQLHARQRLHGHRGLAAATQHARQEVLHVRANPVQQVGITHPSHVGRAQRVVVRRSTRRQQYLGVANTILHGGGNLLQGLDTGQHAHVGLGGKCDESDKQSQESGHGGYSSHQKQVT
ncbi:hypothetical protein D9M71_305030 [compost metagenome]